MIERGVVFQFRPGHWAASVSQSPSVSRDKFDYNTLNYSKIAAFHIFPKSLLTFMYWLEATSSVVKYFTVLLKYDSKDANLWHRVLWWRGCVVLQSCLERRLILYIFRLYTGLNVGRFDECSLANFSKWQCPALLLWRAVHVPCISYTLWKSSDNKLINEYPSQSVSWLAYLCVNVQSLAVTC